MKPLTKEQEDVVAHRGNIVVQASAGTGKTHTLITKIRNDLESNTTHKAIIAITFTIKAAGEIRNRLSAPNASHFIGTNNNFAVVEFINNFFSDVFRDCKIKKFDTNYNLSPDSWNDFINIATNSGILYGKNNSYIFRLASHILNSSRVCKLYIQSKYFKIYVDEYQDCDEEMHDFFCNLANVCNLSFFAVGDPKQSIFEWRGGSPKWMQSLIDNESFANFSLTRNFRSDLQIQNYINLLHTPNYSCESIISEEKNVIFCNKFDSELISSLFSMHDLKIALIRRRNAQIINDVSTLANMSIKCQYLMNLPSFSPNSLIPYILIAKFIIFNDYSIHQYLSEAYPERLIVNKEFKEIMKYLNTLRAKFTLKESIRESLNDYFNYMGVIPQNDDIENFLKILKTSDLHPSLIPERYKHVALTPHAAKGLEFDYVIINACDYDLSIDENINVHYVASTRAKRKLIIVYNKNNIYIEQLKSMISEKQLNCGELLQIVRYD